MTKHFPLVNSNDILIAISVLVILSYLFNLLSDLVKLPSVILLLATGLGLQFVAKEMGYEFGQTKFLLEFLGTIGLIFIVLEGSLDLKLEKDKIPLVGKSFLSAFLVLLATTALNTLILIEFNDIPFRYAVVYAVPLGVISSAIAIPSVGKLSSEKKEFIIYESTFSDILGILLFNYIILEDISSGTSVASFFFSLLIMLVVSAVSTAVLLFLLNYTRSHIKFFLVFAILILIYSTSKMFHLPSLLFILIFGLMLNNADKYIKGKFANYLHIERLGPVTKELKLITAETAFIVRTFFFLVFGYSINLLLLTDLDSIITGTLIIFTILATRFLFLRFIAKSHVFPELFIAPRGLITIVLFYSIPLAYQTSLFNEGILFFVIIASSLIMMLGLMIAKTPYDKKLEDI